jgi:hypothetical protein
LIIAVRASRRGFEQVSLGLAQGADRLIDLAALAFEVVNLRGDLLRLKAHLKVHHTGLLPPASEDVGNLGQRESEGFALENHLEMKPVAGIISAIGAFPAGAQQAAVFIKPERPDAYLEIPCHFPDRKETGTPFGFRKTVRYFCFIMPARGAVTQPGPDFVLGVRLHRNPDCSMLNSNAKHTESLRIMHLKSVLI